MDNIVIKEMEVAHIDDVIKIEQASFSTSWSKQIFLNELQKNKYAHYFIVEQEDKVIGYAGMWIVKDNAQITNIAIYPEFRGRKYGEKLFRFLYQHAIYMGVVSLSLEVRKSNIIAQQMYRKFGLVPGGIRKGYYTDNKEDAIVMWVNLK